VCCQHTLQQKPYNTQQQQHSSTRTQNAQVNSFGSAPVRTSSNNNANRVQQQQQRKKLIIIFDRHLVFYLYILMIEIDDILQCIIGKMSICRLLGYITDDDDAAGRFVSMNGGRERKKNYVKLLALDNYRNEIRETKNIRETDSLCLCVHTHMYIG
jgi:hypothetical protein